MEYKELVEYRRSVYNLGKNIKVSDNKIEEMIKKVLYYAPSYYNAQGTKIILLTKEKHDFFWNTLVGEALKQKVNDESKFHRIEKKMEKFSKAYGTILFFEDMNLKEDLREKFPEYKEQFEVWPVESNAMIQIMTWLGLRDLGFGASIQHYNPLIDDHVRILYEVDPKMKLMAEMPFGEIVLDEPIKPKKDLKTRFKHFE